MELSRMDPLGGFGVAHHFFPVFGPNMFGCPWCKPTKINVQWVPCRPVKINGLHVAGPCMRSCESCVWGGRWE